MPANSRMAPLLVKAEPICNDGSTSGITYLRTGSKTPVQQQPERRVRICERNSPANIKISEERGEEAREQRSLLARGEDHGETGCFPAACGDPWWSRDPLITPGRPYIRASGCLNEAVTSMGSPHRGRLLVESTNYLERGAHAEGSP
ncbi:hypothetical protein BTVI_18859 [Pitangus sulphuratus]|nr:hypothetical protein BTVI_18859 [Pitangus sulphuratus]